jgi:hypothetical protein
MAISDSGYGSIPSRFRYFPVFPGTKLFGAWGVKGVVWAMQLVYCLDMFGQDSVLFGHVWTRYCKQHIVDDAMSIDQCNLLDYTIQRFSP